MPTPIPLMLSMRLAPGDAVVLTALLRDIHRCHPGKFVTRVACPHAEVFYHNPYNVDRQAMPLPPKAQVVACHYGDQLRASKTTRMHFLDGFIDHFNKNAGKQHGVTVTLTDPKPDLYLSDAEKAKPPHGLTSGSYWVMLAGGKADITTKWWDKKSYQAVVDGLPECKFVQAGAVSHYHPTLSNVVRLVSRTNLRQFFSLIYHSRGVVCPITCAMHVAAAFDRPAVVIAGGREMPWWEAYPGHSYLHLVGGIHCADPVACHKAVTSAVGGNRCGDWLRPGQEGNSITVARCMHAIRPEHVIEAVRQHESGSFTRRTWPITSVAPVGIPYISKGAKTSAPLPTTDPGPRVAGWPAVFGDALTVCTVLYGGAPGNETFTGAHGKPVRFADMHRGLLHGLVQAAPAGRLELRVATNAISEETLALLETLRPEFADLRVYGPNENRHKYPRLREMFRDPALPHPWVLCLDDDVTFPKTGWLGALAEKLEAGSKTGAHLFGVSYYYTLNPAQLAWHKSRPWWKGKQMVRRGPSQAPVVNFVLGGAWAMRAANLLELDWPDAALDHNGGDVALGSAVHQRGWKLYNTGKIIEQQSMPRRGFRQPHPSVKVG